MTVSSTATRWPYVGDNSTVNFPYNNKIFLSADLDVYLDDVLQTETTHYTVSGEGNEGGGVVTFVTPPPTASSVIIARNMPLTQETDIPNGGILLSNALENEFDRSRIADQQINEIAGRALKYPVTDQAEKKYDAGNLVIENLADGVAANDAVNKGQMDVAVTAAAGGVLPETILQTVATLVQMLDLVAIDGTVISVTSYHSGWAAYAAKPVGGGLFIWDNTGDKAGHNGATVFDPDRVFPTDWNDEAQLTTWFTAGTGAGVWRRICSDEIDAFWAGAKPDNIANNQKPLQAACSALTDGDSFVIPKGDFRVVNAVGTGATSVIRRADAVANGGLLSLKITASNVKVKLKGSIYGTSELDDVMLITGTGCTVEGGGFVYGNGTVIDTTSDDPLVQWHPSLIRTTGDETTVRGINFRNPSTVGLYLKSDGNIADGNIFKGGLLSHGAGTVLFGIASGNLVGGNEKNTCINNYFSADANGAVYSGIFSVSIGDVISSNHMTGMLEHGVYNYGADSVIAHNIIKDNNLAAGIQNFASGVLIDHNEITDSVGGGIVLFITTDVTVSFNRILRAGLSGIAVRRYDPEPVSTVHKNLKILSNNVHCIGAQSALDIAMESILDDTDILDNTFVSTDSDDATYGMARVHTMPAASRRGRNMNIKRNTFKESGVYNLYIDGFDNASVEDNTLIDANLAAQDIAVRAYNTTNLKFKRNKLIDTRGTAVTARALFADSGDGNSLCDVQENSTDNFASGVLQYTVPPGSGLMERNSKNGVTASGTFTAALSSQTVITNANISSVRSLISFTPINAAAWAIQDSAQRLYVLNYTDGSSVLQTADATAIGVSGALYRYEVYQTAGPIPAWVTGTPYTTGNLVQNAGKEYQATTTGTSGATAPTHTSGTVSDGGVSWLFKA